MADRNYGIPAGHIENYASSFRTPAPGRHEAGANTSMGNATTTDVPQPNDAQALRDIDNLYTARPFPPSPDFDGPYATSQLDNNYHVSLPPHPMLADQTNSQSSLAPLAANRQPMHFSSSPTSPPRSPDRTAQRESASFAGMGAAGLTAANFDSRMPRSSYYHGDGYDYDPASFADDGDDDFAERPRSRANHLAPGAAVGAGAGAAAGGSGMLKAFGAGDTAGGNYGPVGADAEKSEWLAKQSSSNKRMKWIIGAVIAILILGGIAGGVAGGLLANKNSSSGGSGGSGSGGSGSSGSSSSGSSSGGLYDLNSDEVQAVMNNKNLHKVFPAMDYTPNYAQYPQCLAKGGGPLQNNVTIDVAIMSQLTPAIRLYGTDCNQTELVLEAIDRLQMKDTMKVWLGVYLDGNATTNTRQLAQLYDILDKYDHDYFVGAIIGNEVLFSKYMSPAQLQTQITNVRNNFTAKGINIPVSTADLGDNWDSSLAAASDIVMANIHPFFAGTVAAVSAGWAYSFWSNHDLPLKTAKTNTIGSLTYPTQIISEIGWPSQGGNDCGDTNVANYGCTSDTDGAVASIPNLNTFMDGWVCGALNNGTTFFWFEAFDEPWKHQFDTTYDHWEPYWGLFDSDRNLKDGVTIPDCGGKTVDKPY